MNIVEEFSESDPEPEPDPDTSSDAHDMNMVRTYIHKPTSVQVCVHSQIVNVVVKIPEHMIFPNYKYNKLDKVHVMYTWLGVV